MVFDPKVSCISSFWLIGYFGLKSTAVCVTDGGFVSLLYSLLLS